jgi:HAD superfamily hydrolase (TIGR01490 family)
MTADASGRSSAAVFTKSARLAPTLPSVSQGRPDYCDVVSEFQTNTCAAAAFFDVDNTIIRGASIYALGRGLLKADIVTGRQMLGFAWKQAKFVLAGTENMGDIADVQDAALGIVKGRHVDELRGIADSVFDDYMADKVWPGTLAIAQSHLDMGQQVWIVSATPTEVAEVIAMKLGLTGALGTKSEIDANGRYTGRLLGARLHGQAKADAVEALATAENFDLTRCSAYSDSANDIPMLTLVGNPVAINPDNRLRGYARTEGWQVRDFRAQRMITRVGIPAAGVLGFGTGLTVGAIVGTRKRR